MLFHGYRRVFFLVFAIAMFMQTAVFLQSRTALALRLLGDDFKIVAVINNTSHEKALVGKISALADVSSVNTVDPGKVLASFNGPGSSLPAQAVNTDFLPAFLEIKVNRSVMLNPKLWIDKNINSMGEDIDTSYKEDQAQLAVYVNTVNRFALVALLLAAFSLLAFGFFTEAYYTKITPKEDRICGSVSALLAYLVSDVVVFLLAYPLGGVNPDLKYCLLSWQQAAVFLLCLSAGWTLAKWKKF